MGEAGKAAGGILWLVEHPSKTRERSDEWSAENIVAGGKGKNIPLLRFAHDLLLADRTNDQPNLNKAWGALQGYFADARVHGHFMGEEYSTIYWRWIVIPIWIACTIAYKRGKLDVGVQADKWLQDFITLNVLAALPETHYFQSEHAKDPGEKLFGVPCAGIMGARCWVHNEGDDGHRDFEDSMSWVDATSHAPWLAWVLGRATLAQLGGGDGWVKKVTQGVHSIYHPKNVIEPSVASALNVALSNGEYPEALVASLEYGPTEPMVIGRMTNGTWCVGEKDFTSGSTSFMHVKVLPLGTLSYRVYGVAHPLKRSNPDPATAVIADDFKSCVLTAKDGTVFDWDSLTEVEGTLTVPLLDGDPVWVVRVAAGHTPIRLDRAQNGNGDDEECSGNFFKRLWCRIKRLLGL